MVQWREQAGQVDDTMNTTTIEDYHVNDSYWI